MRNNSVIIATNAHFLAATLREKLRDIFFQVFIAANDYELTDKIKTIYPRFVFLEHCFHGHVTDVYIQKLVRRNKKIRIAVWSASELKPLAAARFIAAGAESFISLRDTYKNIESVLKQIAEGQPYYPANVGAALDKNCAYPVNGELTLREKEIIKLSILGKSNNEMSDILALSYHTIRFYKSKIYRRYGGNMPIDILRNAIKRGIIDVDDF